MTERLLDFSESGASLSYANGLLVIHRVGEPKATVPLAEIGAIVTSHRQIVVTQNLVAELGKAGAVWICCDERHQPASMLLPLVGHSTQTERFRAQAAARLSVKKRIWQELVRAKISAQAQVLRQLTGDDVGLAALAATVCSGDSRNTEAVAALRYWRKVFQDAEFRRNDDEDERNRLLNYGYAVLRAIAARAACAAGLHPSLGVGHTNRQNAFCLADDVMEPVRPLLDLRVALWCRDSPPDDWRLNRTAKLALLSALIGRYSVDGERRTLFDILARRCQEMAQIFMGTRSDFKFASIDADH